MMQPQKAVWAGLSKEATVSNLGDFETQTTRTLDCGCMDRRSMQGLPPRPGLWSVFLLCSKHIWGRIPVQDK